MTARRLVIQLSDIHLVPSGELRPGVDPLRNLDELLAAIIDMPRHPDLLLLTGDLVNAGDAASYELLRARMEPALLAMGAAVCYLPGNHDSRAEMRETLLGEAPSDTPIDSIRWCGDLRIIAVDSTVPGEEFGEIRSEQLEWLGAELSRPAVEGTILALHHPPIPSPIESMTKISLREPARLGAVISGTDVIAVLCGHNHHASSGHLGGVPVSVAPASAYQADSLSEERFVGLPGSGFSRVDVIDRLAVITGVSQAVAAVHVPRAAPFWELAGSPQRDEPIGPE